MEQSGKPKTLEPKQNGNLGIEMVFKTNGEKSEISQILLQQLAILLEKER